MRTITALLLLSSFVLVGCNSPKQRFAQAPAEAEVSVEADLVDVPVEGVKGDSAFDPLESLTVEKPEAAERHGPDPFAAESNEPHGLKSGASKKPEVWINFYYLRGHEMNDRELERIIGWSHKNGLTIGTPGEKDFLLTQVRLIDYVKYRDKIKRNLVYEGYDRAYLPTLVLLDSQGRELCYNVGQINFRHLQEDFDKFNRTPSGRKMGAEATGKDSLQVGSTEAGDWVCGPGGCRPRSR